MNIVLESISKNLIFDKFGEYVWLVYDLEEEGRDEFTKEYKYVKDNDLAINGNFLFKAVYIIIDELKKNPELEESLSLTNNIKTIGFAILLYSILFNKKIKLDAKSEEIIRKFNKLRKFDELVSWAKAIVYDKKLKFLVNINMIAMYYPPECIGEDYAVFKLDKARSQAQIDKFFDISGYNIIENYRDDDGNPKKNVIYDYYLLMLEKENLIYRFISKDSNSFKKVEPYVKKFDKNILVNEFLKYYEENRKTLSDKVLESYKKDLEKYSRIYDIYNAFRILDNENTITGIIDYIINNFDELSKNVIASFNYDGIEDNTVPNEFSIRMLRLAANGYKENHKELQKYLRTSSFLTSDENVYIINTLNIPAALSVFIDVYFKNRLTEEGVLTKTLKNMLIEFLNIHPIYNYDSIYPEKLKIGLDTVKTNCDFKARLEEEKLIRVWYNYITFIMNYPLYFTSETNTLYQDEELIITKNDHLLKIILDSDIIKKDAKIMFDVLKNKPYFKYVLENSEEIYSYFTTTFTRYSHNYIYNEKLGPSKALTFLGYTAESVLKKNYLPAEYNEYFKPIIKKYFEFYPIIQKYLIEHSYIHTRLFIHFSIETAKDYVKEFDPVNILAAIFTKAVLEANKEYEDAQELINKLDSVVQRQSK